MITTKRQIRRDTDRFGGYGTESTHSRLADIDDIGNITAPSNLNGNSLIVSDTDFDIRNSSAAPVEPQVQPQMQVVQPTYTTREQVHEQFEVPYKNVPPRPENTAKPLNREDVLPTIKTQKYATEKAESKEKTAAAPAAHTRRGLDGKQKVLLCVYVAVALVLAIAVIATGVSISTATAQADMISGQIYQKQAIIMEQEATIAGLLDDDVIGAKAEQLGMVKVDPPEYNVPAAPTYDYPEADPKTNGFDEFCDWLS